VIFRGGPKKGQKNPKAAPCLKPAVFQYSRFRKTSYVDLESFFKNEKTVVCKPCVFFPRGNPASFFIFLKTCFFHFFSEKTRKMTCFSAFIQGARKKSEKKREKPEKTVNFIFLKIKISLFR
jgi:hypothetical protein